MIEKDPQKINELRKLNGEFPKRKIHIYEGDANDKIKQICEGADWHGKREPPGSRAVMFLDPYGCQVDWDTIEAIARTGAVDMWYLFPSGQGIGRMLAADRKRVSAGWERRLDKCLGTAEWRNAFYRQTHSTDLWGNSITEHQKVANADLIESFFLERLRSVFPHVAPSCLRLENRTGYRMFSLCFASANPGRGGEIAVNIASHLLREKRAGRKG